MESEASRTGAAAVAVADAGPDEILVSVVIPCLDEEDGVGTCVRKALAARPGHVKSRDQLMDSAYGESIYVDDRTIDSHIKRLRKKFKDLDEGFNEIETLYGVGYRYKDR